MEKSRIPVYSQSGRTAVGKHFPTDTNMSGPSKRSCLSKEEVPEFSKDPNFAFAANCPGGVVFNAPKPTAAQKQYIKKVPSLGETGRYRVEAELRDRNQLLEAANRDLHLELSGTQNHIQELTEKSEKLESDIKELNQQLESCLVVLETRNIDPVTGSKIVESVEENDRSRAETMLFHERLL
uniref:Uncharacterized protein n=1 Tax=Latimeria chalumnae TaxID=7897 RepID=H3BE07_LATCH